MELMFSRSHLDDLAIFNNGHQAIGDKACVACRVVQGVGIGIGGLKNNTGPDRSGLGDASVSPYTIGIWCGAYQCVPNEVSDLTFRRFYVDGQIAICELREYVPLNPSLRPISKLNLFHIRSATEDKLNAADFTRGANLPPRQYSLRISML